MAVVETERWVRAQRSAFRLSWGAIFGGAVAALGMWILLYALGLALGLSSLDPGHPATARGAGIFTGIWGLVSPLIALFIGGMVAGRGSGTFSGAGAAFHGLVMWGLATIAGAYLVMSLLGSVVGTVASAGKAAVGAAGSALAGARLTGTTRSFQLDAEAAVGPINERLEAEGKPTITVDELQAWVRDALGDAVREGRLDREMLASSLAENSALSQQDAEEVAGRIQEQFDSALQQTQAKIQSIKQDVQAGALRAADRTGKVFWGVFGALFLGLVSAVLGAMAAVARQYRYARERAVIRQRVAPSVEREVHP